MEVYLCRGALIQAFQKKKRIIIEYLQGWGQIVTATKINAAAVSPNSLQAQTPKKFQRFDYSGFAEVGAEDSREFLFKKFRFWTFMSMVLLLFVHSYNINQLGLTPSTTLQEPLTFNSFTQYLVANGLVRFRLPLLFCISGYLFALKDVATYTARLKKAVKGLLIPYFLWSFISVAAVWLYHFPDEYYYSMSEAFNKIAVSPVAYHLWFLKALFIYRICYPLFLYLIQRFPVVLLFYFFLWVSHFQFYFIDGDGLFFFNAGIFLFKTNRDLLQKPRWVNFWFLCSVFITLLILKTCLAFGDNLLGDYRPMLLTLLYKISALVGLVIMWFGSDRVVNYCMRNRWFLGISQYSFIIYAMHILIFACLFNFSKLIRFDGFSSAQYQLLMFFVAPFLAFCLCVATGCILKNRMQPVYRLLTGGRG